MTPIQELVSKTPIESLLKFWRMNARPVMLKIDPIVVANIDAAFNAGDTDRVRQLFIFIPEDILSPKYQTNEPKQP